MSSSPPPDLPFRAVKLFSFFFFSDVEPPLVRRNRPVANSDCAAVRNFRRALLSNSSLGLGRPFFFPSLGRHWDPKPALLISFICLVERPAVRFPGS